MTAENKPFTNEPEGAIENILRAGLMPKSLESLSTILSCIDLTTLNTHDTLEKVRSMCRRVNTLPEHFPGTPNVGAICVYPSLVEEVSHHLEATGVGIASVGGGFPSSQTFLDIKIEECILAVKAGASEVDIVISVGKFLEGDDQTVAYEISRIKDAIGKVKLKVILETGLLLSPGNIYRASELAIQSGANFIKTSTGKVEPAASLEAVHVMCEAIRNHYNDTGTKIGIKPAGGIATTEQALQYMSVVRAVLGETWLHPGLFRIGASKLTNRVLEDLQFITTGKRDEVQYF